jgi:predicted aspartyl protease
MQRCDSDGRSVLPVTVSHPATGVSRRVRGLVDTGASHSSVKTDILERFAEPTGRTDDVEANASSKSKIFRAKLALVLGGHLEVPLQDVFDLLEFQQNNHPHIDMLVGRGVLRFGILLFDGTQNQFELKIAGRTVG